MSTITQKICLLGDFNVGKTSLVRRFIEDKFSDRYLSTVGVKVSRKSLNVTTDTQRHQLNLLIWDLEGNTKFKSITPNYLKGASGSIIVADLSRSDTLNNLTQHLQLFFQVNPQGQATVALNKADLIPPEKLAKLVENYQLPNFPGVLGVYTTSAKTGDRIEQMFQKLATVLVLAEKP
jgi:small GTP-binding protein